METRGILNDVELTIGKAVYLDYGVALIQEELGTDIYAPQIIELMELDPENYQESIDEGFVTASIWVETANTVRD